MTEQIINGVKVIYKSIPPLAVPAITQSYEKHHPKPQRPFYEIDTMGTVVKMFHDETSVVGNEEDEKAWAEYIEKSVIWQTGLTEKLMILFLLEGIELDIPKKIKEKWDSRLNRLFEDFDAFDDDDKHLAYVQTFIFTDQAEIETAIKAIMSKTGVSQEDVTAADSLF